mmetsp:Transcript_39808/g.100342  ORF Transcript_39808/g.100342 Transcript_39808/m.100342 type:complete len:136 (-) Transcript_39808:1594-2001(-)
MSKPGDPLLVAVAPAMHEFGVRLSEAQQSQKQLEQQVNALETSIDQFENLVLTPPIALHVHRLADARNRLGCVNQTLSSISERLVRLEAVADRVESSRLRGKTSGDQAELSSSGPNLSISPTQVEVSPDSQLEWE